MKLDFSPATNPTRRVVRPSPPGPAESNDVGATSDESLDAVSAPLGMARSIRQSISLLTSILIHCFLVVFAGLLTLGNGDTDAGPGEVVELAVMPAALLDKDQFEAEQLDEPSQPQETLANTDIAMPDDPFVDVEQLEAVTPNSFLLGGGDDSPAGFGPGGGSGASGQASFMGLQAFGRRFCIIADRSGSMSGKPLSHVKKEILKTVDTMSFGSAIHVVFYSNSWHAFPDSWGKPKAIRDRVEFWLRDVRSGGGTFPQTAFDHAFDMTPAPDAIFFMTDGKIPAAMDRHIERLNASRSKKIPVHTIAFLNRAAGPLMKKIASESGGKYRYIDGF